MIVVYTLMILVYGYVAYVVGLRRGVNVFDGMKEKEISRCISNWFKTVKPPKILITNMPEDEASKEMLEKMIDKINDINAKAWEKMSEL